MGMVTRLAVWAPSEAAAEAACRATFKEIARLDGILSDWRIDSELTRLGRSAGGPPVPVGPELWTVLSCAQDIAARSHGAFDATVGPLVALWRKARATGLLPDAGSRAEALARVGWDKLRLDEANHTAQLLVPRMKLDLGGIAKGYIGDCAVAFLRARGLPACLFQAGGDIVLGDPPPGQPGWLIDVGEGRRQTLSRCGVACSGDTVQFVEVDGVRYSHVVDPRTGLGLTSRLMASLTAPSGMLSDALGKVATVLGADEGPRVVATYPGVWLWLRPAREVPAWPRRPRGWADRGLF